MFNMHSIKDKKKHGEKRPHGFVKIPQVDIMKEMVWEMFDPKLPEERDEVIIKRMPLGAVCCKLDK